jgi:predicted nucleic acid-binding protein
MSGTKDTPSRSSYRASIFLDSNVVLYLLSGDAVKADRAEALLARKPFISVQVLNEVTHVCLRKLKMSWGELLPLLEALQTLCRIAPVSVQVHELARQLAQRYSLAFYDACIVAAASIQGCDTLYSEDMQDGLIVEGGLLLKNPFAT